MRECAAESAAERGAPAVCGVRARWSEAIVSVIRLQREYARLISQPVLDDRAVDAAWLRLWKAQDHERRLSRELDFLSD